MCVYERVSGQPATAVAGQPLSLSLRFVYLTFARTELGLQQAEGQSASINKHNNNKKSRIRGWEKGEGGCTVGNVYTFIAIT